MEIIVVYGRLEKASLSWNNHKKSLWDEAGANLGVFWVEPLALAAWANDLTLGLGLEAKGTSGGALWGWAGLESVVAAVAGFEAVLVVTILETGGALKTSEILFLKLVGEGKDTLAFLLLFLLVTRVKVTSSTSGASTLISTSGDGVGIRLEP